MVARLLHQSGVLEELPAPSTLGEAYENVFRILRHRGNRDDYVFRSALTQKLVLGRHSLRTTAVMHELRVGSSKVDMVVVNGGSTAFEIKSDRDTLARLLRQIEDYRRAFTSVVVVASAPNAAVAEGMLPPNVGVMSLSDRYTLRTLRPAVPDSSHLSSVAMIDVLRRHEAVAVVRALGVEPPVLANTQVRSYLTECAKSLSAREVHAAMVNVLRRTRSQSELAEELLGFPPSLRAAMLSLGLSNDDRHRLAQALDRDVRDVATWG